MEVNNTAASYDVDRKSNRSLKHFMVLREQRLMNRLEWMAFKFTSLTVMDHSKDQVGERGW